MSPELIGMISVGAAIVGALLAGIWVLLNRMDNAIDKLKIELKADIADSETRLRQEIAASETRQKEEIASIRKEITDSETRRKEDTASIRKEIADSEARRKEDTASIRNDIASIRNEIAASEARQKEETASIRNDIASIREDIKELRNSVINLGQRVARVEALLIKDFATELAIDPTQLASEPEYRAGVSEPKPDGAT